MMTILSTLDTLFITHYIAIGIFVALAVSWLRLPSVLISGVIVGAMWRNQAPLTLIISVSIGLGFLTIPWIRAMTLSRLIMILANKLKVFPSVSSTEQAALDAGTVWIDRDIFSGNPCIKTMMNQPILPLSSEEQNFLSGPVAELCNMINDWDIQQNRSVPDDVWRFICHHRFLGMIIPKEYGGLGLSAIGHSAVIERIASVSPTVAIMVMVPNSLGPAELLMHYGTESQKERYLAKLAIGEEIPCFGLTEPTAGSDAGSLQSEGVIIKGDDGHLYIKFQWNKRWITLSGMATVIGLAFQLKDPDQLLKGPTEYGITCALIPTQTPGVDVSRRHDPMGIPFMNCPMTGTDVVMPLSCIIGERDGIGNGWTMLMDCLSAGRGVSLPSLSLGGAQSMVLATSSFGVIRQQFGMSIGMFEGIQEPLARIVGKTIILKAMRDYTCGAIDQGEKPSVVSAIAKLHSTEMFRDIVRDSMDILGGAGITQGPRNVTVSAYKAAPIGITVEGANILTRTLIIFGQGALRCHPFAYDQITAAKSKNIWAFDAAFFGHISHIIRTQIRVIILTLTQGRIAPHYGGLLSPYKRKLVWASALFALMADAAMLYFRGGLKSKQKITGRLGDMLSWLYLATATMAYYEKNAQNDGIEPVIQWALAYCFYHVQTAMIGFFDNITGVTRWVISPLFRLFPLGRYPSDALGRQIATAIQSDVLFRDHITNGICIESKGHESGLRRLNHAYHQIQRVAPARSAIRTAIKQGILPKKDILMVLDKAVAASVLTEHDAQAIRLAEAARMDAIQVDDFSADDYAQLR